MSTFIPDALTVAGGGESRRRYSMFPIKDQLAFEFYKKQQAIGWVADEVDFTPDALEYKTLKPRYQELYKDFLAFFAPGDGVITAQALKYLAEAKTYEETSFIIALLNIEQTHAETYGLAIVQVITDEEEQEAVFDAVDKLDCVKNKAIFVEKWMNHPTASLGTRYLAGAFGEGVFFAALFAMVFYFRTKNIFKAFLVANEFIMRDETLHRDFNSAMAKRYGGWTREEAVAITEEAVAIEIEHLKYILRTPIDSVEADAESGLSIEIVSDYVRSLADQVLVLAGTEPLYNVRCSLPWMTGIGAHTKPNFYETRVVNYQQLSVKAAIKKVGDDSVTVENKPEVKDSFLDEVDF